MRDVGWPILSVRIVRVGDMLQIQRRAVELKPTDEYREIGLRSFGKGVFHKAPISGSELGDKRVFRIMPGDLVVSNVFAWEGAIAIAGETERGFIGSHRFMTWTATSSRIDPRFVFHYFSSEAGLEALRRASPGSAGRNRTLAVRAFEDLTIPLPDIAEQRAIAERLDRVAAVGHSVSRSRRPITQLIDRHESLLVDAALSRGAARIGNFATVNPSPVRTGPDESVLFLPMADLDELTGTIRGKQVVNRSDVGSGFKQFRRGDIIFARITPSMQNGKSAVFDGKLANIGYGSTEFHVLRTSDDRTTSDLHSLLRTKWFRTRAMAAFTGTAGQQRVPAEHLRDALIPQLEDSNNVELFQQLRKIDLIRRRAVRLEKDMTAMARALPQAARNAEFARLMS